MKIELNCAACGSNHFELGGPRADDAVIACGDCGHVIGTLGELKLRVAEEVLRRSRGRSSEPQATS